MSNLTVPTPEELEEDEFDEIIRRFLEVLNHQGLEYNFEDGYFLLEVEVEQKLFSVLIFLSKDSFLEIEIHLAGELQVPLKFAYASVIEEMQKRMYGRLYFEKTAKLLLWRYEGIPVSVGSMEDVVGRLFDEIVNSLRLYHLAFTAMEDGVRAGGVLQIIEACHELAFSGQDPGQFH